MIAGEEALEAYFLAISDLEYLDIPHMKEAVARFHRGWFNFLKPAFCPKPNDLRRMLETTHSNVAHQAFKKALPEIAAKKFATRSEREILAFNRFNKALEQVGVFNGHLVDVEPCLLALPEQEAS